MSEYWKSPEDLKGWVQFKSKTSYQDAASNIIDIILLENKNFNNKQDVYDTCESIVENNDDNASRVLFDILAKHNITKLNKKANKMNKNAQTDSRQRNNWNRSSRNKWNRTIDLFNEETPWRVSRDKYYDFTHYATDEIKFDEDPNNIYSGEAIWRTYIMDKFYSESEDQNGKLVGGYINDRFHVFPDAGTPANKDVPRDGGNPMNLKPGTRSRQPRPHEYSIERRMEEARGNKTKSIVASNSDEFTKLIKITSKMSKNLKEASSDKVYNMFKDVIDMREEGIDYETILSSVSEHYNTSIFSVAQIDKVAQKLKDKHEGMGYKVENKKDGVQSILEIQDDADALGLNEDVKPNENKRKKNKEEFDINVL